MFNGHCSSCWRTKVTEVNAQGGEVQGLGGDDSLNVDGAHSESSEVEVIIFTANAGELYSRTFFLPGT